MKLNWGSGIAIFYIIFVSAMISMVVKSCQNQHHLVEEEYYQKDLGYEGFRLKRANGESLKKEISTQYIAASKELQVNFPEDLEKVTGELKLYRPSNKFMDKKYTIKLDSSNSMKIKLGDQFRQGLWKIQLDWLNKNVPYYNELDFSI
jgi:hypothetical protein